MNDNEIIQDVIDHLSLLEPEAADAPPETSAALAQFKRTVVPRTTASNREHRSRFTMSNRRYIAAGLTFVMGIALLLAFPSVRAAAGEFLGLFRVQKFAPISISPENMALLGQLEDEGLSPGEVVFDREPGEPVKVESLEEAAELTGYRLRQMRKRDWPAEIFVMRESSGYLDVDLAGLRAIVAAAGVDPLLLPDSLDGARVNVQTYPGVQQVYADGLVFMQTPSPDVSYPADVDPAVIGEALLRVLGTDPAEAQRMARSIDWTSTMLLPIPQSLGTYREVTVNGVSGVALEPLDPGADPALVWQKDDMVFMLTGPAQSADELIEWADRIR